MNEATESAVRLTLFKTLLDHGYSEEQAASGAKNVTINFNRKGQVGSFLNSGWLFANAGLQGNMRIYGVLKNSKKARRAVAGIAALGLTESILNNMYKIIGLAIVQAFVSADEALAHREL